MKSKRKTPKTLCMIVSILFVTLLFVPNSKNHFLLAGIGIFWSFPSYWFPDSSGFSKTFTQTVLSPDKRTPKTLDVAEKSRTGH